MSAPERPDSAERWTVKQEPEDGSWEVGYVSERDLNVVLGYGLTEDAARLIAAAPDMLALLLHLHATPLPGPLHDLVQEAIAKARGDSQ